MPCTKAECSVLKQRQTTTYVHDLFLDVDNANNEDNNTEGNSVQNNSPVQDKPTCADKQDQHKKSASDLLESSAQGKKLIKNVQTITNDLYYVTHHEQLITCATYKSIKF